MSIGCVAIAGGPQDVVSSSGALWEHQTAETARGRKWCIRYRVTGLRNSVLAISNADWGILSVAVRSSFRSVSTSGTVEIEASDDFWHTVIGVAKDVRQRGVERPAGTELYVSLDQHRVSPPSMNVVMRTTLPPAALSGTIERVVREVDAAVPVVRLRNMDSVFAESIRRPRLLAQLLGAFAGLALLLAAIGTYGVLSYMVTERRREIGIRVALGATRSHVLTQIMKQGLQVTALGVTIGLAGALAVNRLIASLLFGVQPTDTVTIAFVIATITAVAVVASWLPAWRASRVDPNVVLRDE